MFRANEHSAEKPDSPIKPPERCPACNSRSIAPKGRRTKKLEMVRLYRCASCKRVFTPGPLAIRQKVYPLHEILDAISTYNRGYTLEETSRRLSSRYGHAIHPATISRWLAEHPRLTTYQRLRDRGLALFTPPQLIRTVKLYHRQVYEFAAHRAKAAFIREGTLDDRRRGNTRFAPIADFLDRVHHECPHELFRREDGARASQLAPGFLSLDRLVVFEKQNTATETAALIIPSVGTNYERHPRLQRFMLINDSTTVAVEVPIFLLEEDIAALEEHYGVEIVPKEPVRSARPALGHKPRFITGHIDLLQVRNGSIHVLDYKPDARTNKPIVQLLVYALALTRLVPDLVLSDISCAWFNETAYNEFSPRRLLRSVSEKRFLGDDF
jgi:PD-(D/E)XK nuclease superfamily protein